jgi:hypothetical protein
LVADDAVLGQIYGNGVHAYFGQEYQKAYDDFSSAIDGHSRDPRCYYFRGLTLLKLGRPEQAETDFEHGAKLESAVDQARAYDVARSLERIQGSDRSTLEKQRMKARIAVMKRTETDRRKYEDSESKQLEAGAARTIESPTDIAKPVEVPGDAAKPAGAAPAIKVPSNAFDPGTPVEPKKDDAAAKPEAGGNPLDAGAKPDAPKAEAGGNPLDAGAKPDAPKAEAGGNPLDAGAKPDTPKAEAGRNPLDAGAKPETPAAGGAAKPAEPAAGGKPDAGSDPFNDPDAKPEKPVAGGAAKPAEPAAGGAKADAKKPEEKPAVGESPFKEEQPAKAGAKPAEPAATQPAAAESEKTPATKPADEKKPEGKKPADEKKPEEKKPADEKKPEEKKPASEDPFD